MRFLCVMRLIYFVKDFFAKKQEINFKQKGDTLITLGVFGYCLTVHNDFDTHEIYM